MGFFKIMLLKQSKLHSIQILILTCLSINRILCHKIATALISLLIPTRSLISLICNLFSKRRALLKLKRKSKHLKCRKHIIRISFKTRETFLFHLYPIYEIADIWMLEIIKISQFWSSMMDKVDPGTWYRYWLHKRW